MTKIAKITLMFALMNGLMLTTWADKGVGKKKAKVSLNLANNSTSKNLTFNLKSEVKYKGSLLNGSDNSVVFNNTVTYKNGKTVYIIPGKQKVVVPEMKQGYTGLKLILKPKL